MLKGLKQCCIWNMLVLFNFMIMLYFDLGAIHAKINFFFFLIIINLYIFLFISKGKGGNKGSQGDRPEIISQVERYAPWKAIQMTECLYKK